MVSSAGLQVGLEVLDFAFEGANVVFEGFKVLLSAGLLGSFLAPCALRSG